MKKTLIYMISLMFSMSLCGCTSFDGYPSRSGDVEAELDHLEKYFDPNMVEQYESMNAPAKKALLRNEIVNGRMRAIDLHFNDFQQRLYREGVSSAIATDWAILGLGGAGAVVNSLRTSQTLSAISGGVAGGKASWDKNALFDKTMPAILAQMIALRKDMLATIRLQLLTDTENYPLNEALMDVEDYFFAGTMPGAISAIVKEAGAISDKADSRMEIVLKRKTKDDVAAPREARIKQILPAIAALDDDRAFELNKNPPVVQEESLMTFIRTVVDKTGERFTNGDRARHILNMMVALGPREDEDLDAWDAALKAP